MDDTNSFDYNGFCVVWGVWFGLEVVQYVSVYLLELYIQFAACSEAPSILETVLKL